MSVHDGVVVQTTLDPTEQPFLDDHRIDGMPVLPGVMGMEAFAETARLLAAGPTRGRRRGRDVRCAAEVLPRRTPHAHRAGGGPPRRRRPRRPLPTRRRTCAPGERHTTAHGALHGTCAPRAPMLRRRPRWSPSTTRVVPSLDADRVYSFYFHGPAYQVVESGVARRRMSRSPRWPTRFPTTTFRAICRS